MKQLLLKVIKYEFGLPSKMDEYQQAELYKSGFYAFAYYFIFSFIEVLAMSIIIISSFSDDLKINMFSILIMINFFLLLLVGFYLTHRIKMSKIDLVDANDKLSYQDLIRRARRQGIISGILFLLFTRLYGVIGTALSDDVSFISAFLNLRLNIISIVLSIFIGIATYFRQKKKIQK